MSETGTLCDGPLFNDFRVSRQVREGPKGISWDLAVPIATQRCRKHGKSAYPQSSGSGQSPGRRDDGQGKQSLTIGKSEDKNSLIIESPNGGRLLLL
jgi:hypothetical protein